MKKKYIIYILLLVLGAASAKAQNISGDDFSARALPNAAHALEGQLPGLGVSFESGNSFAASELSLRGLVSSKGIAPLVLVDGIEMSIDDINPEDIEKVEVLKEASAYAMYGARAAGGAIIVTLRNGSESEKALERVSVNLFTGVTTPRQTSKTLPDGLYRNASLTHNYNISAKGGNDVFNYYVGGRYFGEESSFSKDLNAKGNNSFDMAGRFDARITKWLRYNLAVDYVYRHSLLPYHLSDSAIYLGLVSDDQDEYMDYMKAGLGTTEGTDHHFVMKNGLVATIAKGLTLEANYSFINKYDFDRMRSSSVDGVSAAIAENNYYEDRYNVKNNAIDVVADYGHSFGCGLNLAASAGYDWFSSYNHYLKFGVSNLIDSSISTLTAGDGDFVVDEEFLSHVEVGGYARLALDWKKKFFLDGTFRVDASSKLPSDVAYSGAAKAAYDVLAGTDKGKLLVSYSYGSLVSAENIGCYAALSTIDTGTADAWLFSRKGVVDATTIKYEAPADLTWERVNTHNVGVEGAFLKNRLGFGADAFYRNTSEINSVEFSTLGYELSLGWKDSFPIGSNDFSYAVNAYFADYSSCISAGELPVEPRYNYILNARAGWAGIDLAFIFDGVGKRDWSQEKNPQWDTLFFNDLASASYFRMKSLTAGYTFNFKKGIALRLGIDGENLFYVSPFKKFTTDIAPELAFSTASLFQNRRAILFNVKLNF